MASIPNVFIFNNIKNNKKDIENLHGTFSSIGCGVAEIMTDKYAEVVKYLQNEDFSNFKFIVIAVLDNTNEDERYFKSSDGKQIELYTGILETLYENASLHKKLCLFLLQINRVYSSTFKQIRIREDRKLLSHDYVMYFATSTGCYLDKGAWDSEGASPFVSILCEEIRNNSVLQRPITKMLNDVTDRIGNETNECPSLSKNIDANSYCIR